MNNQLNEREIKRKRRVKRIRKKLYSKQTPFRLSVFRSNKHLSAQIVDDEKKVTIASFGTLSKEAKEKKLTKKSKESARFIGEKIASYAKDKQIERIIFDRGRFKFHGLIAEIAEAARQGGLKF